MHLLRHVGFLSCLAVGLLALAGCVQVPQQLVRGVATSAGTGLPNPAEIQRATMSYADRFTSDMSNAYGDLILHASTPEGKEIAFRQDAAIRLNSTINAVSSNPLVGLMDMTVLASLNRRAAQSEWARKAFGPRVRTLIQTAVALEKDAWHELSRWLDSSQMAELRQSIDSWVARHPDQRFIADVQLADLPSAQLGEPANRPRSIFALLGLDPLSGVDPAVRELERTRAMGERVFYFAQRMPAILSQEIELRLRQTLDTPEVSQLLEDTSTFVRSTDRLSESLARLPKQLTSEREQAMRQLAQIIDQERKAALNQASSQVTTQRVAAIRQLATATSGESKTFNQEFQFAMRQAIDHLVWQLSIAAVITVAIILLLLLAYRMTLRRLEATPVNPRHART